MRTAVATASGINIRAERPGIGRRLAVSGAPSVAHAAAGRFYQPPLSSRPLSLPISSSTEAVNTKEPPEPCVPSQSFSVSR